MTDELGVLICVRTANLRVPAAGSARYDADCGHEVWIAPTGVGLIIEGKIERIACVECGTAEAEAAGGARIVPPTEAQRREIIRELKAWLRSRG